MGIQRKPSWYEVRERILQKLAKKKRENAFYKMHPNPLECRKHNFDKKKRKFIKTKQEYLFL